MQLLSLVLITIAAAAVFVIVGTLFGQPPGYNRAGAATTGPSERTLLENDYRQTRNELALAGQSVPYVVLDFARRQIVLKLNGAVVFTAPMEITSADTADIAGFIDRFNGDSTGRARLIEATHLFDMKEKISDSVLAIVSKAVNVDPALLQRALPERFLLKWDDGLVLDIHAEVDGRPVSLLRNALVSIGQALQKPFGESALTVSMDVEAASTLLDICRPGVATLVVTRR